VAALDDEIRIIKSKLEIDVKVHIRPSMFMLGEYMGMRILLVRSGIGPSAMTRACLYLLKNYQIKSVIHVGYCGGCDPRLICGDMIIAQHAVDSQTNESFEIPSKNVARATEICRKAGLRSRLGTMVTLHEPVPTPHEKAYLGTKYGAAGIDMESASLAAGMAKAKIDYVIARSVLDPLDTALPNFGNAIDESGEIAAFSMAENLIKNPKDLIKIPQISYLAMQARQSITSFVDAWLEELCHWQCVEQ